MRVLNPGLVVFLLALSIAAIWPFVYSKSGSATVTNNVSIEWAQANWVPQNTSPVRLPLAAREQRFSRQFPGHIARFADNRHEWIVRVMDMPTRMLHPADDCFKGLGYKVTPARVHVDQRGENWRCFTASGKGKNLNVCERIFDAKGGHWTDASSWYWSALLEEAQHEGGPWWAVTKVEAGD
jgi:hypothetical protein